MQGARWACSGFGFASALRAGDPGTPLLTLKNQWDVKNRNRIFCTDFSNVEK
jgi:hypothetical protein